MIILGRSLPARVFQVLYDQAPDRRLVGPIFNQQQFPRTKNFPKISLLKVENFQLQNFFPTENLCRPITFYKMFFLRKKFRVEMDL
jgi:hypothetical protein